LGRKAARACGEGEIRKECGARLLDVARSGPDAGLGGTDVGAADEQLGRLAGADFRHGERFKVGVGRAEQRRFVADEHCKRVARLDLRFGEAQPLGFELAHFDALEARLDLRTLALAKADSDDPVEFPGAGEVPVEECDPLRQYRVRHESPRHFRLDRERGGVPVEGCGLDPAQRRPPARAGAAEQVCIPGNVQSGGACAEIEGGAACIVGLGRAEPSRGVDHGERGRAGDLELRPRLRDPRPRRADIGIGGKRAVDQRLQLVRAKCRAEALHARSGRFRGLPVGGMHLGRLCQLHLRCAGGEADGEGEGNARLHRHRL
jgi:hypothetical protein